MNDFSVSIYEKLLHTIISKGYACIPYLDYIEKDDALDKFVILRHDVDGKPDHSLEFAAIQNRYGVRGTYYFRNVPESFDERIVSQIAALDHEIGFHYEDLSQTRGDHEAAIRNFENFLSRLRTYYPVKTLCMHGSPLSKYDNRAIWKKYSYRDYGLVGEPYFDTNFKEVWYLSDTGRAWNNKSSVRDWVSSPFQIRLRDTDNLIELFEADRAPYKVMINIHPQRWTNNQLEWYNELIVQNIKNVAKYGLNIVRAQPGRHSRQMGSF